MIQSMTGFGQATRHVEGYRIQVEMKSVNHRYQETIIRMSREWLQFEDAIKKRIQHHIRRGRVEVFVTLESSSEEQLDVQLNWPLIEGYYKAAEYIADRLHIAENLSAKDVLHLPDVVHFDKIRSKSDEWIGEQLIICVDEALHRLQQMRRAEGAHLFNDITSRLTVLEQQCKHLHSMLPQLQEHMTRTLRQRMTEMLADTHIDEQRLLLEVALATERAGIDEELTRLQSHLHQTRELLDSGGPAGRKLDFLMQEMNRETNTIGAKSNIINLVSHIVEMKAELEKVREQVQNIE